MTRALLLLSLCLPAAARAAAPADGRATAAAEAELRSPDAELVEIEGFVSPDGDIPCRGKSFSNAWHYKFHVKSTGEWMIVNACGENFINAAKHFPYRKSDESDKALPRALAAPAAVLKKLKDDGLFSPEPNPFSRDIQMLARLLPAKDGRPAGCYWTVGQGKAKFLTDCEAKTAWRLGKAGPAAPAGPKLKPKKKKNGETAGRSLAAAYASARAKAPSAVLMMTETLPAADGTLDCVAFSEWTYVFWVKGMGYGTVAAGCGKAGALSLGDFTGKYADLRNMQSVPDHFRDSDEAASVVPETCPHKRVVMKLRHFKPANTPVTGHQFLWEYHCGSRTHYVDAHTGLYLGKY